MKINYLSLITACLFTLILLACNDDDESILLPITAVTFENLHAPATTDYSTNPPTTTGDYTKFSFSEGGVVTGDNWDVAFRTTTILVNGGQALAGDEPVRTGDGGAYIVDGLLSEIASVNIDWFNQDSTTGYAITSGSGNGWYTYNFMTNIIDPIPGKVLIIKTHDGKYAKMEIKSYYENAPVNPDLSIDEGRYYTFDYVYQPNDGLSTF